MAWQSIPKKSIEKKHAYPYNILKASAHFSNKTNQTNIGWKFLHVISGRGYSGSGSWRGVRREKNKSETIAKSAE